MLIPYRNPLHKLFTSNILMGSKPFLKLSPFTVLPTTPSSRTHLFHTHRFIFSSLPSKPILKIHPFSLKYPGFSSVSDANIHRPVSQLYVESPEEEGLDLVQMKVLSKKMEELGIDSNLCKPGQYNHLICPMCKGIQLCGPVFEQNVAGEAIQGPLQNGNSTYGRINQISKVKQIKEITEKSLELEPLCSELRAYFAERMISAETLRRNSVMQRRFGDQIVIAFPYRRNGVLVSCKYRNINKKFWQEKDTEKIFYGLDDIKDSNDIIIVEGEIDKLAMEEAGFRNCVSVPDGAPPSVSNKELPSEEQDTKYQYLWNCKEYLEKASRIILATDGDKPGQALAEELARRLGRQRCGRVKWPKKNDVDHFKDANEVLMYMGPGILKEVIESTELCTL